MAPNIDLQYVKYLETALAETRKMCDEWRGIAYDYNKFATGLVDTLASADAKLDTIADNLRARGFNDDDLKNIGI